MASLRNRSGQVTTEGSFAGRAYRWSETLADNAIHIAGVSLGVAGAIWLVALIPRLSGAGERLSMAVYAFGLVCMLTASAAYNMWPPSPAKQWLRRIDHSAIYIMIAATYSPFITQIRSGWTAVALFATVWTVAIGGTMLKLLAPGRFDRLSIVLYLALGWSGIAAYDALVHALDPQTWRLVGLGGAIYSIGVIFHLWEALRFHNAIWHLFVLTAAAIHYFAVLSLV